MWGDINASALTGWGAQGPGGSSGQGGSGPVGSGMTGAVTNSTTSPAPPVWSPDNPLFWFGVILAATAGLLTISTTFNAGPLKGKASV